VFETGDGADPFAPGRDPLAPANLSRIVVVQVAHPADWVIDDRVSPTDLLAFLRDHDGGSAAADTALPPVLDWDIEGKQLRIAMSTNSGTGVEPHEECVNAVNHAAKLCGDLGHHIEEAAPPIDSRSTTASRASRPFRPGHMHDVSHAGSTCARGIAKPYVPSSENAHTTV